MFNIVSDRVIHGKPYPALAQHRAEPYTAAWREFGLHWPYTVPVELVEYCREFGVECNLYSIDVYPANSYYVIHLGWFDHEVDYIALLPLKVLNDLKAAKLRILFYYHEGDDPVKIKLRLDALCAAWDLNYNVYRFVSGNTRADLLSNFIYFADHELLYYNRNKNYEGEVMEEPIELTEEVAPRRARILPMVAPRYDDVPNQAG